METLPEDSTTKSLPLTVSDVGVDARVPHQGPEHLQLVELQGHQEGAVTLGSGTFQSTLPSSQRSCRILREFALEDLTAR